MKLKKLKKYLFLLPIVIVIIFVSFISPETITEKIGTQNIYIVMFFIALVWGLSLFSAVPYPLFLITFSLGGGNPIILALCTTCWVMLWDSTSYILGRKWRKLIEGKWADIFDTILHFYDKHSKYMMWIFFLYGVFSPFPNDLITLSSGIKKYPYLQNDYSSDAWKCYLLSCLSILFRLLCSVFLKKIKIPLKRDFYNFFH